MKIYKGRIPLMATEIANTLISNEAIEVEDENLNEFKLDIESVLTSYVDTERRIHEEAQDLLAKRGADFTAVNRFKHELAKKYNFALGEEAVDWITDQIIEMLYHTCHVEEIWADNPEIRRLSRDVLYKHTQVDEELDAEVRKRIKNLSEGSMAWDVKYQQVLSDVRRKKGL